MPKLKKEEYNITCTAYRIAENGDKIYGRTSTKTYARSNVGAKMNGKKIALSIYSRRDGWRGHSVEIL